MARKETVISVFLASPSDLSEERETANSVIMELNRMLSRRFARRFELIRWETDVSPGVGKTAQDVIDEQIPIDYDVFVGLLWKRFGSPTNRSESGTEQEFDKAYERCKKGTDPPRIMFYFKDTAVQPSEIQPEQLAAVKRFQQCLAEKGVLYKTFGTTDEFAQFLRLHLSRVLQEWEPKDYPDEKDVQGCPSTVIVQPPKHTYPTEKEEELEEGFLDLVESSTDRMQKANGALERMTEGMQVLGKRFAQRTDEFSALSAGGKSPDIAQAKRAASNVAEDLDEYIARMTVELPILNDNLSSSLDEITRASVLSLDFGDEGLEPLAELRNSLREMRGASVSNVPATGTFREILRRLPRLTTKFNRSRRNALKITDDMIEHFASTARLLAEAENTISAIIARNDEGDCSNGG